MAEASSAGNTGGYSEQELRAAQIARFVERTPLNVGAAAFNTMLFLVLLFPSAPRAGLLTWSVVQLAACSYQYFAWRRRREHVPRGSVQGVRRLELMATAAGFLWGSSVFLLDGANELQRSVVLVSNVAMVSGAATTLVWIPNAARGYIVGVLSLCILAFLLDGHRAEVILAGLALSLMLFLLRSSTLAHRSFMEELRLSKTNEQLITRFRAELGEWLDLSHGTEAFALVDKRGKLLLWNHRFEELYAPAALQRGVEYEELLRQSPAPLRVNGISVDRETWLELRRALSAESEPLVEEYEGRIWKRVTTSRGARNRRVVLIVDVTSLKLAELTIQQRDAALARTQRLETVGTLAGGVAHDFNNMLTGIQGFAELLKMEVQTPDGTEAIAEIQQCVARGTALTRQLLAYGRRQTLNPRPIDLAELVNGLQRLIKQLLPASVQLVARMEPIDGVVRADPNQLEQVLLNLVINARDAMPQGGTLLLQVASDGTDAVMTVSDTGTGMDDETVARAFEPFFTTKQLHLGSGLGLAVSHGIVRQSGGKIEIESELGNGTAIHIRLPLARGQAVTSTPVMTRGQPERANGETVLVVDDDEKVRKTTSETLKRLGYTVLSAAGPAEALQLWPLEQSKIALILTDVMMPEMNGPELVSRLFSSHRRRAVVYMTGYDAGALSELADNEVLTKPFTELQLAIALRHALNPLPQPAVTPVPVSA